MRGGSRECLLLQALAPKLQLQVLMVGHRLPSSVLLQAVPLLPARPELLLQSGVAGQCLAQLLNHGLLLADCLCTTCVLYMRMR